MKAVIFFAALALCMAAGLGAGAAVAIIGHDISFKAALCGIIIFAVLGARRLLWQWLDTPSRATDAGLPVGAA